MYRPGHYGMVLLLYSVVGYALLSRRYDHHAVAGGFLVVLVTMLPDWDGYVSSLPHRGPTHTVWFALLVGAAVGAIAVLDGRRRGHDSRSVAGLGLWASGLATFSVLAHLVADALNPMGIRPFYPASAYHVSLDLFRAGDPVANFGLLSLGLLATGASWRFGTGRAVHDVPALPVVLRGIYEYVRDGRPDEYVRDGRPE